MTQRARASFNRATRFGVVTLAVVVLMLMSGDRPLGQAPAGNAVDFDGTNDYITFGAATGARIERNRLHARIVVQARRRRHDDQHRHWRSHRRHPACGQGPWRGRGRTNVDTNYFLGLNSTVRVNVHACGRFRGSRRSNECGRSESSGFIGDCHCQSQYVVSRRRDVQQHNRRLHLVSQRRTGRHHHRSCGRSSSARARQHSARLDRQRAHLYRRRRGVLQRCDRRGRVSGTSRARRPRFSQT